MYQRSLPVRPVRRATLSRRALPAGAALTVAGGLVGVPTQPRRAAASWHQGTTEPVTLIPTPGPTFVGTTSDPMTLRAIVLPEGEPDTAVTYLCRGPALSLWFTGHLVVPARTEGATDFRWIMRASGQMRGTSRRRSEGGTELVETGADI